jgi:hypothetical protein
MRAGEGTGERTAGGSTSASSGEPAFGATFFGLERAG